LQKSSSPPPPPLPPKCGEAGGLVPPRRPQSKELQLEDILSMCAEYERQIETEQREAMSVRWVADYDNALMKSRRGNISITSSKSVNLQL
jgi:hypothetical protein